MVIDMMSVLCWLQQRERSSSEMGVITTCQLDEGTAFGPVPPTMTLADPIVLIGHRTCDTPLPDIHTVKVHSPLYPVPLINTQWFLADRILLHDEWWTIDIILPSVCLSVMTCIVALKVGVWGWTLHRRFPSRALPIHFFRHFYNRWYRSSPKFSRVE